MAHPHPFDGDDRARPSTFGDYTLLSTLARGGMGSIHLAKRHGFRADIQRFCVVKTLLDEKGRRGESLRRFHDEARVVVTLNHRAICHVFDVGIVDGEHYLAMELIEGKNLAALSEALHAAGRKLDPAIALYILDEILEALDYAHELKDPATGAALQIVHRDVSPHNVMLSFQGGVKLIDFGLVTSSLKREHTVGGLVAGKLDYMAPEQARGEALTARADVYAAAIILVELLSGRRFYGAMSKAAVSMHLTDGSYAPPLDDVPAALRPALSLALAGEPADRTPSCAHFQRELQTARIDHATARDLRALIDDVMPGEKAKLEARVRGFHDVAPPAPPPGEVTRTLITHIAGSSDVDERTWTTTSPAPPEERAPSTHVKRAVLGVVAFAVAALVLAALCVTTLCAPAHEQPLASLVVDAGELVPQPVPEPVPQLVPELVPEGAPRPVPQASAQPRARPPATPLPDLAAAFAYLARYCSARAPSCTQAVLAQRGRVAVLDAAGLRALRRDADACVVRCRR